MARIYFAGAESLELLTTLLDQGIRDIMLSYFYLQQRGALPRVLALLRNYRDLRVFLDSGATTFIQKDRGDPQLYWRSYFEFLRGEGHRFEYASEFDIDGYTWMNRAKTYMVSDEQLAVWRDDLAELEMVPIVPIWHPSRGIEAWEQYCRDTRFPHLGISKGEGSEFSRGVSNKKGGGGRIFKGGGSEISTGAVVKMVAQAHGWGKTTHGFGTPALTELKHVPHDTVSSTTWLVGQKFGDICIFQAGQYRRIYATQKGGKKDRQKYRQYFTRIGCDWAKIEADDRQEINKANILAWKNFSARLQVMRPPAKAGTSAIGQSPANLSARVGQKRTETATGTTSLPHPSSVATPDAPHAPDAKSGQIIPLTPVGEHVSITTTSETPVAIQMPRSFMPPNTPGLHCSNCSLADRCPKFEEGAACAFKPLFSTVGTRDVNEIVEELGSLFAVNMERARYARLTEELVGEGYVSKEVTAQMETTFHMGAKLAELMKGRKRTTTLVQGEGLIRRLFGTLGQAAPTTTLTADPVPVSAQAQQIHPQTHDLEDDDA